MPWGVRAGVSVSPTHYVIQAETCTCGRHGICDLLAVGCCKVGSRRAGRMHKRRSVRIDKRVIQRSVVRSRKIEGDKANRVEVVSCFKRDGMSIQPRVPVNCVLILQVSFNRPS